MHPYIWTFKILTHSQMVWLTLQKTSLYAATHWKRRSRSVCKIRHRLYCPRVCCAYLVDIRTPLLCHTDLLLLFLQGLMVTLFNVRILIMYLLSTARETSLIGVAARFAAVLMKTISRRLLRKPARTTTSTRSRLSKAKSVALRKGSLLRKV